MNLKYKQVVTHCIYFVDEQARNRDKYISTAIKIIKHNNKLKE